MKETDPLQSLVRRLAHGTAYSLTELASVEGISPELLTQMLMSLERGGYIRQLSQTCSHRCAHCPLSDTCIATSQGRIWVLTEKGKHLADRGADEA